MTEPFELLWADTPMPNASSIDESFQGMAHVERAFSGRMLITVREEAYKRKWVVSWEGASELERSSIYSMWQAYWHSSNPLQPMDVEGVYNVVSPGNGYKETKRYNPALRHWRYKISITYEEV